MKAQDLAKAKSPELRASLASLERACALARERATQTDTDRGSVKDGPLIKVSANQLRRELQTEKAV